MRNPVEMLTKSLLVVALLVAGAIGLCAQTSNRVWFVSYNGEPTPSGDVSVQSVTTAGKAAPLTAGSAAPFVSQTNFPAFNSPFDVAVDPAMGKAYVLDNNVQDNASAAGTEIIYAFNLAGTPAQIAAGAQVIYTLPVPAADGSANLYPLISGLALDPANHWLYFNQIDVTTRTNSFVGRLELAGSSLSNVNSPNGGAPVLHTYYTGQVPGQGPIAVDATNLYLGAISRSGNSGVFAAPRDGSGTFSELVAVSTNDITFTNGFVSGVASDVADHLVYYLTFNAGYVNGSFDTNQNALWVADTVGHTRTKIASGYPGYPDNLALDPANQRYYFTLGRDGTGNVPQANHQALYTGTLGSTNAPTLLYTPPLTGLDAAGQINAGRVVLQGIFVEDAPTITPNLSAVYLAGGGAVTLAPGLVVGDPNSTLLAGATVAITGGIFAGDGDVLTATTTGTQVAAAYNAANETLTLSGSDLVTNYQQVLRTVAFSSTNPDPSHGGGNPVRTISWMATDGVLASATSTTALTTLAVSAPPTNRVAIAAATGSWTILYTGASGTNYTVQSADFITGPWSNLSPVLTANARGFIGYQDPTVAPKTRFYRAKMN